MVEVKCFHCNWRGSNTECKGVKNTIEGTHYTYYSLLCPQCGHPVFQTRKTFQFYPCRICGVMVSNCGRESEAHRRKHEKELGKKVIG